MGWATCAPFGGLKRLALHFALLPLSKAWASVLVAIYKGRVQLAYFLNEKVMPASNHSSCSSCYLCETMCTPVETLPGYDQQRVPLPPLPRERGRSRVVRKQSQPVFCSPVILATHTPVEVNADQSYKWRPSRRRSASARQRQGKFRQNHFDFEIKWI